MKETLIRIQLTLDYIEDNLKAEITPQLLRQVADSTNLLPNGYKQLSHDEVYEILMECV